MIFCLGDQGDDQDAMVKIIMAHDQGDNQDLDAKIKMNWSPGFSILLMGDQNHNLAQDQKKKKDEFWRR